MFGTWMNIFRERPSNPSNVEVASEVLDEQAILGEVANEARQEFLADRAHTEMREDTAYQRAVFDMRRAGLNPYTVGSSPAASSASKVGESDITNKISLLGYLLDLKNLDLQNKALVNKTITSLVNTGFSFGKAFVK